MSNDNEMEFDEEQMRGIIDQLDPVSVCILHHYAESGQATGFSLDGDEVDAIKHALERLRGTDDLKRSAIGLLYLAQAFEQHDSPAAAKALYSLMSWPPILDTISELRAQGLDPQLERAAAHVVGASPTATSVRSLAHFDRLTPEFQEALSRLIRAESATASVPKADLVKLQKLLPGQRALSRLKRPAFGHVSACVDQGDYVMRVDGEGEICRLPISDLTKTLGLDPGESTVRAPS